MPMETNVHFVCKKQFQETKYHTVGNFEEKKLLLLPWNNKCVKIYQCNDSLIDPWNLLCEICYIYALGDSLKNFQLQKFPTVSLLNQLGHTDA